jgi:hypothetical protein
MKSLPNTLIFLIFFVAISYILRLAFEILQPDSSYINHTIFEKIHIVLLCESFLLSIMAYLFSEYFCVRETTEKDKKISELNYKMDRQDTSIATFCEKCMTKMRIEKYSMYYVLCKGLNKYTFEDQEIVKLKEKTYQGKGIISEKEDIQTIKKLINYKEYTDELLGLYRNLIKSEYKK